jgi:hypothetical protein
MKRVDRVIKEHKEIMEARIRMLQKDFRPVEDGECPTERPWMFIDEMKKFEDVSWAREQYAKTAKIALGLLSDIAALKLIFEAEHRFHEPPARGRRKI